MVLPLPEMGIFRVFTQPRPEAEVADSKKQTFSVQIHWSCRRSLLQVRWNDELGLIYEICIAELVLITAVTSGRLGVMTLSNTSWMNGATQYCEPSSGCMPHSSASR